jgi:predicted patatin/cPLA2 family phospholipase
MGTEKVSRKLRASVVSAGTEAEGKVTNLALQGGGAHGAFGWEVMDQFLEDGRLSIEGVSGTSVGSTNAVVYAYGKIKGNDGSREALHKFWKAISDAGQLNPENYNPYGRFLNRRLYPLFYETKSQDVVILHINPIERSGPPKTSIEIANRLNEIEDNYEHIGVRSSVDLKKEFL